MDGASQDVDAMSLPAPVAPAKRQKRERSTPVVSWFSSARALWTHEVVSGACASLASASVDVPHAHPLSSLMHHALSLEPEVQHAQAKQTEASRVRRGVSNAMAKRLTNAQEHLDMESFALGNGRRPMASWRDGNVGVVHLMQLSLQRYKARYNAELSTKAARACAEEYPGSAAAEGAGQADAARPLEDELASVPRVVLEPISYADEEAWLRPPDFSKAGETECSNGQNCQGVLLIRDGFVSVPEPCTEPERQGFPLATFVSPWQAQKQRPKSRDGLCLLCIRNRVTWTYRALLSSGTPANTCIAPHRVLVGPGEYAPEALLCPATLAEGGASTKFLGLTDPFVSYNYNDYELVRTGSGKLRFLQKASEMRFRTAPHTVLAPFEVYGGAGWIVSGAELKEEEANTLVREAYLKWAAESPKAQKAAEKFPPGTAERAFKRAFLDVHLEKVPRASLEKAVLLGWKAARTKHHRSQQALKSSGIVRTLAVVVPTREVHSAKVSLVDRVAESAADCPDFFLAAVRLCFAGCLRAQLHFAEARLQREGPAEAAHFLRRSFPSVCVWALRGLLVRLVRENGSLRQFLVKQHRERWVELENRTQHVVRLMNIALQETGGRLDKAEEAAAMLFAKPMPLFSASPRWFWDALAALTKGRFEALCARDGETEGGIRKNVPVFDVRWAYEGVPDACRAAGLSGEALGLLVEMERAHAQNNAREVRKLYGRAPDALKDEVTNLCTAVQDGFSLRCIRAPAHWMAHHSKLERRTFLSCPCCRVLKSHVAVCAEEYMRTKRGRTPATAAVELKRHAAYCRALKGKPAMPYDEWARSRRSRTPAMAALELRKLAGSTGTTKVAFDPVNLLYFCNPKQKTAKIREALNDVVGEVAKGKEEETGESEEESDEEEAASSSSDSSSSSEEEAEPQTKQTAAPRNKNAKRTVVAYASCQKTPQVPVDFRGVLVEFHGRLLAQCWSCGLPTELGPRCFQQGPPGAFLCGWCTPPRAQPDPRLQAKADAVVGGGKRKWSPIPDLNTREVGCCKCNARLQATGNSFRNWHVVRCILTPFSENPAECHEVAVCPKHQIPKRYSETAVAVYARLKESL